MSERKKSFTKEITLFLDACPGPGLARSALRIAALQEVDGIPELSPLERDYRSPNRSPSPSDLSVNVRSEREYIRTIARLGSRLHCRPAYLSEAALRHGYSLSKGLRWVRLMHGVALRTEGIGVGETARRLGFDDRAGWSRFAVRLVGTTSSQLPEVPLSSWVRRAVEEVFLNPPAPKSPSAVQTSTARNAPNSASIAIE